MQLNLLLHEVCYNMYAVHAVQPTYVHICTIHSIPNLRSVVFCARCIHRPSPQDSFRVDTLHKIHLKFQKKDFFSSISIQHHFFKVKFTEVCAHFDKFVANMFKLPGQNIHTLLSRLMKKKKRITKTVS